MNEMQIRMLIDMKRVEKNELERQVGKLDIEVTELAHALLDELVKIDGWEGLLLVSNRFYSDVPERIKTMLSVSLDEGEAHSNGPSVVFHYIFRHDNSHGKITNRILEIELGRSLQAQVDERKETYRMNKEAHDREIEKEERELYKKLREKYENEA